MESNADNDCKSDSENSYVKILRDEKEDYKKEDDDIEVLLGNSPTEADVVTQSDTEHVNVSVNMSRLPPPPSDLEMRAERRDPEPTTETARDDTAAVEPGDEPVTDSDHREAAAATPVLINEDKVTDSGLSCVDLLSGGSFLPSSDKTPTLRLSSPDANKCTATESATSLPIIEASLGPAKSGVSPVCKSEKHSSASGWDADILSSNSDEVRNFLDPDTFGCYARVRDVWYNAKTLRLVKGCTKIIQEVCILQRVVKHLIQTPTTCIFEIDVCDYHHYTMQTGQLLGKYIRLVPIPRRFLLLYLAF